METCDALIIGAGPAGLTAAVYLARYRRRVLVLHDGASRAARIPRTYNVPGFPRGVAGPELLQRMEEQASLYGAVVRQARVETLKHEEGVFRASTENSGMSARAVILATGVRLNQIDLPDSIHEEAIRLACLRYCPICDGYEATGKRVGVLGSSTHGASEALFLRDYTDNVTMLAHQESDLTEAQRAELSGRGVQIVDAPVAEYRPGQDGMDVVLSDGRALRFDVLYPAIGVTPRSGLASQLGVEMTDEGCIVADARQRLSIPGLYAAGDVVEALDQISVAIGHGAIAGTQAHNFLREMDGRVLHAR